MKTCSQFLYSMKTIKFHFSVFPKYCTTLTKGRILVTLSPWKCVFISLFKVFQSCFQSLGVSCFNPISPCKGDGGYIYLQKRLYIFLPNIQIGWILKVQGQDLWAIVRVIHRQKESYSKTYSLLSAFQQSFVLFEIVINDAHFC